VLEVTNALEHAIAEFGREKMEWFAGNSWTRRVREEREVADHIFVPSEFVAICLLENGVPAAKLVRIPYGADPDRFTQAENPPGQRPRVLFVGLIGVRKGVRYLLDAWALAELDREAELVLAGPVDAAGRELLRTHAGRFTWAGQLPRHEIHRVFASADIFAFPSLCEGSAYVVYEAMATGLPVVTTPNAGSVVRDGVDGYVVSPRDVKGLADRLTLLIRNADQRRRMGLVARRSVVERYTWRHYHQRVRTAYAAILGGRDPSAAVAMLDHAWGRPQVPSMSSEHKIQVITD
jgi:glycosyltransferase involved in cell wall biosynthesis